MSAWTEERDALAAAWFAQARMGIAETYVYRYYDAADHLLYVGQSSHPDTRDRNHRNARPWYADVARRDLQGPFTKDIALAVEFFALRDEKPCHNRAAANGYRGPYSLAWYVEESREYERRCDADPDFHRRQMSDVFEQFFEAS